MMPGDEFRLIVRPPDGGVTARVLPIPGPTSIECNARQGLCPVPLAAADLEHSLCVVEPIQRVQHDRELLMLCSVEALRPLLNGLPLLPVSILHSRDEVVFPAANVFFHVTVHRASPIRPLLPAETARSCVLCRAALLPSTVVYCCCCGALLCGPASDSAGAATDLCCSSLSSECPNCSRPIIQADGYEFWPEDIDAPQP
jgi:hypothetical protein